MLIGYVFLLHITLTKLSFMFIVQRHDSSEDDFTVTISGMFSLVCYVYKQGYIHSTCSVDFVFLL